MKTLYWWVYNLFHTKKDYRYLVTADDIRELDRLFLPDSSFVGFDSKGEKYLVGYLKD